MKRSRGLSCHEMLEGQRSILLSAPHAFDHKRPSLTVPLKQAEPWTDIIAHEIASETGAYGLFQRKSSDYDPNYHREKVNPYKQDIRKLHDSNKIEYILDVHGLSDQYPLDVVIYYPMRFRRSRRIADQLSKHLDSGLLKGLSIHIYNFDSPLQETISEFAAEELKVPSIQLEISRYIREEEQLRKALIENLAAFVTSFSL